MTMNWKRNSKKYIAGILTIALAAGVCQSYGSMEVSAQEMTLPGLDLLDVAGLDPDTQGIHILLCLRLNLVTEGLTIITQLLQALGTGDLTHGTL